MTRISLLCILLAGAASAEPVPVNCIAKVDPTTIASILSEVFEETLRVQALDEVNNMIEIYISKIGTWTEVTTQADGFSCITRVGRAWQTFPTGDPL